MNHLHATRKQLEEAIEDVGTAPEDVRAWLLQHPQQHVPDNMAAEGTEA